MQKTCLLCEKQFEAKRAHAKFCKAACRNSWFYAKPLVARMQARIDELALQVAILSEKLTIERGYSKELETELKAAPMQENPEPEYDSEFSFD